MVACLLMWVLPLVVVVVIVLVLFMKKKGKSADVPLDTEVDMVEEDLEQYSIDDVQTKQP